MKEKERVLVLRHLTGSVWTVSTADGDEICQALATGTREIGGHHGIPATLHAGEQVGALYVPYDRRVGLFELAGRYLRPRPVTR